MYVTVNWQPIKSYERLVELMDADETIMLKKDDRYELLKYVLNYIGTYDILSTSCGVASTHFHEVEFNDWIEQGFVFGTIE